MKYKVLNLEKRRIEKINKSVIEATLVGEDGVHIDKVQIWQGFPNFDSITFDQIVEGEITTKVNGKYTNKTLSAPKTFNNAPRSSQIAQAQEKKAEYIEKAQDRKNEAISFFNATNNAIQLLQAYQAKTEFPLTDEGMQKFIRNWRVWFLNEWQRFEAEDYKDKHQPF